jgi:hypothetical protein
MSLVTFALTTEPNEAVATLLAALRSVFGEQHVAWAGFVVVDRRTPDWLFQHTLEGSRLDLGPLLLSEAFAQSRPALAADVNSDRMACFELLSAFDLGGEIAKALTSGGADLAHRPRASESLELAHSFVDALVGRRAEEFVVLRSRAAWSAWFACDVWDRTWAIADAGTDQVWLLCVTDVALRPLHPRGR